MRCGLLKDLEDILKAEETMWRQRSRENWLAEGDSNTAFFHRAASHRRRTNNIVRIIVDSTSMENQDDILKATTMFFKNLVGVQLTPQMKADWQRLYPIAPNLNDMDAPFQ